MGKKIQELQNAALRVLLPLDECESPIEEMFLLALAERRAIDACPSVDDVRHKPTIRAAIEELPRKGACDPYAWSSWGGALLINQPVGRYRIDFLFLLLHHDGSLARIAVELDGHDFHERTKEQARRDKVRDRWLQMAGHHTLRFTGSEVYADAGGCVDQIEHFWQIEWSRRYPL